MVDELVGSGARLVDGFTCFEDSFVCPLVDMSGLSLARVDSFYRKQTIIHPF